MFPAEMHLGSRRRRQLLSFSLCVHRLFTKDLELSIFCADDWAAALQLSAERFLGNILIFSRRQFVVQLSIVRMARALTVLCSLPLMYFLTNVEWLLMSSQS